jgi:hypothetical protein
MWWRRALQRAGARAARLGGDAHYGRLCDVILYSKYNYFHKLFKYVTPSSVAPPNHQREANPGNDIPSKQETA